MAVRVHRFQQLALLVIQTLDLVLDVAHLVRMSALVRTHALEHVNALSELAPARFVARVVQATVAQLYLLLDQLVLPLALLGNLLVLLIHVLLELLLRGLLQAVLGRWQLGNLRLSRKHYLFVFLALHVVEFVHPRVLVLLLFVLPTRDRKMPWVRKLARAIAIRLVFGCINTKIYDFILGFFQIY